MIRAAQIACLVSSVAAATFVFQVKYRAEHTAERVADLQRQVDGEKERISLLKAEWSLLIQPSRVQEVAERHQERLELAPVVPAQMVASFADLPIRPPTIEDIIRGPLTDVEIGETGVLQ